MEVVGPYELNKFNKLFEHNLSIKKTFLNHMQLSISLQKSKTMNVLSKYVKDAGTIVLIVQ